MCGPVRYRISSDSFLLGEKGRAVLITAQELVHVPKVQRSILESPCNHTSFWTIFGLYPSNIVETSTSQSRIDQCKVILDAERYRESVAMLADGWSSIPWSALSKSRSHNSSWVSLEKSASTAPALVPVAINGAVAPGDHAKVAVRGISRSLTMLFMSWLCGEWASSKGSAR